MSDAPKPVTGAPGDPGMDDILASIRRILNEDEATGGAASIGGAASPVPPVSSPPEPLDLTEAMLVQSPTPVPEPAPPAPVVPAPVPAPLADAVVPVPVAKTLVAPAVLAATTAAVGQLLRTVAQERSAVVHRGGPSIEDVVREELRPLLKAWLDEHLPPLVERAVRAEIERVVGRALS